MCATTVHPYLHNSECLVALVPDAVIETEVDAPSARRSLLTQIFTRVLLVGVVVAGVKQLPIDQIVATFESPREKDIVLRLAIANRVTGWKEATATS